jgi:hypothetical protein
VLLSASPSGDVVIVVHHRLASVDQRAIAAVGPTTGPNLSLTRQIEADLEHGIEVIARFVEWHVERRTDAYDFARERAE